ncbi:hypothetical protein H9P43_007703 [Blastocladiella emersonii ATCC 22665]|nr:hypothetical protein H9P43_007703 [Blastocladiella emersonii ATCC 22665]
MPAMIPPPPLPPSLARGVPDGTFFPRAPPPPPPPMSRGSPPSAVPEFIDLPFTRTETDTDWRVLGGRGGRTEIPASAFGTSREQLYDSGGDTDTESGASPVRHDDRSWLRVPDFLRRRHHPAKPTAAVDLTPGGADMHRDPRDPRDPRERHGHNGGRRHHHHHRHKLTRGAASFRVPTIPHDVGLTPSFQDSVAEHRHRSWMYLAKLTFEALWAPVMQFGSYNQARYVYEHERRVHRELPYSSSWRTMLEHYVHKPRRIFFRRLTASKPLKAVLILAEASVDMAFVILYLIEMSVMGVTLNDAIPIPGLEPWWLYIPRPHAIWFIAVVLAWFNLVSFLVHLAFADTPRRVIFSPLMLIELLTTAPMIVSMFLAHGPLMFVPYYLRCIAVIPRLRRFLHIRLEVSEVMVPTDALREKLIVLVSTLLAIIYTVMCSVQYAEMVMGDQVLTLMDTVYFTVVSLTTVGYGDITAKSTVGRIVIIIGIILAFVAIPPLVSSAMDTYRARREGGGIYERRAIPHVVLIGRFDDATFVSSLLHAFFFNENAVPIKVVLLTRRKPSSDVKTLINTPAFRDHVFYIMGSALNEGDLSRAQVRSALGVFFISNNTSSEDERNVLRVWSVARFAPEVELYIYTHRPEYERFHYQHATAVVCADDLKQALLGCNSIHRGVATLVTNLINNSAPLDSYAKPWMVQYGDGLGHEIYNFAVRQVFVGRRFHHLCAYLFIEFQVIAIAVRIPIIHRTKEYETTDNHVVLNPSDDYVIRGNEEIVCIAQGMREIDLIQALTPESFERSLQDLPPIFSVARHDKTMSRSNTATSEFTTAAAAAAAPFSPTTPADALAMFLPRKLNSPFRIEQPEIPFSADTKKVPLCHLLPVAPSSVHDVEVHDVSGANPADPRLEGHVVVITPVWNLFRFCCTIRSAHIPAQDLRWVLFVSRTLPTPEEFHFLAAFPRVRYMCGNPRWRRDLMRANLHFADRIIILAAPPDDVAEEDFADLQPILTRHLAVHTVAKLAAPPIYTMVELNNAAAISFLAPSAEIQGTATTAKSRPMGATAIERARSPARGRRASISTSTVLASFPLQPHVVSGSHETLARGRTGSPARSESDPLAGATPAFRPLHLDPEPTGADSAAPSGSPTVRFTDEPVTLTVPPSASSPLGINMVNADDALQSPPAAQQQQAQAQQQPEYGTSVVSDLSDFEEVSPSRFGLTTSRRRTRRRRKYLVNGGSLPGPIVTTAAGVTSATATPASSPVSAVSGAGGGGIATASIASTGGDALHGSDPSANLRPRLPARLQVFYDPQFASGEAFCSDMLDTILIQHFFQPTLLDITRLFSGIRSRADIRLDHELKVQPSFLYTIDVPGEYIGRPFKDLFLDLCLGHGVVVLGLYRAPSADLGNAQSFVYTAPHPDVVLRTADVAYVLTRLWKPEPGPVAGLAPPHPPPLLQTPSM